MLVRSRAFVACAAVLLSALPGCNSDDMGGGGTDGGTMPEGGGTDGGTTPEHSDGSATGGDASSPPAKHDGGSEPLDGEAPPPADGGAPDGASSTGPDGGSTSAPAGTLTIDVVHASYGGDVTITGPNGFSQHITKTTTFTGVAAGGYQVRSFDVRSPDVNPGRVTKANPARASATVGTAGAVVTVDYSLTRLATGAVDASPKGIWFTEGSKLVSLITDLPNGDFNADFVRDLAPAPGDQFQAATALAFDAKSELWIADSVNEIIERLGADPIGSIDLKPLNVAPYTLAFDKSGNLWVEGQNTTSGVLNDSMLLGFAAADLANLGATPIHTSSKYSIDNYGNTEQTAFDATGTLWMTFPLAQSVGAFLPRLAETYPVTPEFLGNATFNASIGQGADLNPTGVAFDASGNLWVTHRSANEVVGYPPANLTGRLNENKPVYHIDLPAPTVNGTRSPVRLTIDPCTSELYVVTATLADEHVYRYAISDPTAPKLLADFTSPDIGNWLTLEGVATNPIPPGMPLGTAGPCNTLNSP